MLWLSDVYNIVFIFHFSDSKLCSNWFSYLHTNTINKIKSIYKYVYILVIAPCHVLWFPSMQCSTSSSSPPETPHMGGDLTQLPSKDVSSGDSTSELASPKALTFDLLNMVISFKRMAIYLEPITDTVDVLRYLLGWEWSHETRSVLHYPITVCAYSIPSCIAHSSYPVCVFRWRMPLCSLMSCILLNILFLTLSEGEMDVKRMYLKDEINKI